MSALVWLVAGLVIGFAVGRWDEAHNLTWRARWEVFIDRFGRHTVSEYSGRCIWCDKKVAEPKPRPPLTGLLAGLNTPITDSERADIMRQSAENAKRMQKALEEFGNA